jgi:UbiD family decarboxylase
LRSFVEILKQQGKLLIVDREVEPKFEVNAIIRKVQEGPNLPVLFRNIRGCNYPVLSGPFGDQKPLAFRRRESIPAVASATADLASMLEANNVKVRGSRIRY